MRRILYVAVVLAMASPVWAQPGPRGPQGPRGPRDFPGGRRDSEAARDRGPATEINKLKAELQKLQARLSVLETRLNRTRDGGLHMQTTRGPGGFGPGRGLRTGSGFGQPSMRGFGSDFSRPSRGGFGGGFSARSMSGFGPGFGGPRFGQGPYHRTGGRMERREPRGEFSSFERRLDRIQKQLDDLRRELHQHAR